MDVLFHGFMASWFRKFGMVQFLGLTIQKYLESKIFSLPAVSATLNRLIIRALSEAEMPLSCLSNRH